MLTTIAICVVILTFLQLVWTAVIVVAMLQVRRAAVAVENLAITAKQPVDKLVRVVNKIEDIAALMSGWYRAVWMGMFKAVEMWVRPKHDGREVQPEPQKERV